jgi:phage terminase large subunit
MMTNYQSPEIDDLDEEKDDEPFIVTTALKKISGMTKRKRVLQGGASSSKTFSVIPILIDTAIRNPGREISIVSESVPHLKKGAMKDFKKIMRKLGRWKDASWNTTDSTYTFSNKSYIEFFSVKDEGRVRGPRRHYLFLNECNNIPFEAYHQLAMRTSKVIWMDYNPSSRFWVHSEVLNGDDAELLILTYKDNEGIPEGALAELLLAKQKAERGNDPYWKNYWTVYGLGQIGALEGAVYSNWETILEVPRGAEFLGIGLDFGYSNSKCAIVARYQYQGKKIWDEVTYETGLLNHDIYKRILAYGASKFTKIVADQAEPKSIADLRAMGLSVYPCKKGRDSVIHGIQLVQSEPFYVTERSLNMINELRNYVWEELEAPNGRKERTNNPVKAYDDLMDAMRYFEQSLQNRKRRVKYIR